MLDFHAHILPELDDGSSSVEESIFMLRESARQGTSTVCATPHFYPDLVSLDEFLEKRQRAFESIAPKLTGELPNVILGAEVLYYDGICKTEKLPLLRLSGTKLLLLEMPDSPWTSRVVSTVVELAARADITVVLAHIERYLHLFKRDTLDTLLLNGVLIQADTSFFINRFTQKKALNMLAKNKIQFLGTDCHNMTDRKPNMDKAISVISKKLGSEYLYNVNQVNEHLTVGSQKFPEIE